MAWPISAAIPIYSKRENTHSSALAPKSELLKSILEIVEIPLVQVSASGDRLQWVREESLWSPVDLTASIYLRPNAEIKKFSNVTSPNIPVETNGVWSIVQKKNFWLQVKQPVSGDLFWVRTRHAQASPDMWDYAMIFDATQLLLLPQQNSNRICPLSANTAVKLISFHGHYAKVSACGGMGFVHLSKMLTKAHFAKRVRTQDKQWHHVARVNTNEIIDTDYRPISFATISGFEFEPKMRYTKTLTKVTAIQSRQERWARSHIKDFGFFWWNMNAHEVNESHDQVRVKSKNIFTGKIFDAATNPLNPAFKIISSSGIYLTRDGSAWEKLDYFADENFPIFITSSGRIFIGPYVSFDQAKTFKPYIRWERLFSALGARGHFSLAKLRISDIQIFDDNGERIKLVVYVGERSASIFSEDMGRTWKSL
ncbi:MAG: hypothetical protein A4S09_09960 [Proteobacteria bacterium SG_bin7]|nr:MAG: hypothetical protein A4S09_09960 [Proteobacteria bacterium SG_bin7]